MKLLKFLRRESNVSLRSLTVMAGIAGLSNAFVLAIINVAVQHATDDVHRFEHLLLFLLAIGLYITAQRYIMVTSTAEIESILHRIRLRLGDKIRRSDQQPLEKIGRSEIYASVTRETQTISNAAGVIVVGLQAAILIFFTVIYIAWLSRTALLLAVGISALAMTVYFRRVTRLHRDLHRASERENRLFELLTDMLDGFKEVKMNPRRSDGVYAHYRQISESTAAVKIDTQTQLAVQFIFSQTMFYLLVAAMVFVVPRLSETYNDIIVKATTAVLFLIAPISNMVSSVPIFANANVSIENIERLEGLLDESAGASATAAEPAAELEPLREITFDGVTFQFKDSAAHPFTVGPVDLTLNAGETVFISGGNGSGKSTFLMLLLALYYPQKGVIRYNGTALVEATYPAYRQLFAVVFSDYHLFRRLYGLDDVTGERIAALLADMELENKTRYKDGEFTTLELSSGQKKRLALLVSLLEDRPIYVFDEWAADQDPIFRRKFYEELLVQLKDRGKTVIAVTHDDRYYECADRLLKMEEGKFVDA